jgi:polysaccharide chain length determinant protein (PEP-CTERM system associated)
VLPGKNFTPEEIIRIVLRRMWLLAIPLVIGGVAAFIVAKRMPDLYQADTLIMLVPQRVPDSYVKTTVTTKIEDRLGTLEEQILSRSRLERIIVELGLYSANRGTMPMQDVVLRMRNDITVNIEGKESFRVSYVGRDPKIVQQATERLASLFIEENLRDRENVAVDTNKFLESQLEDARRQLIEREKKLEEFRSRYSGELPTQAAANLQALQNAQLQLQNLAETVDRDRERRLLLERQLIDLQAEAGPTVGLTAGDDAVVNDSTAFQLQKAQADLNALLLRAKPDHPDVRALQRTIRDLGIKLNAENLRRADSTPLERPLTPAEALQQKRGRDLKAEIEGIDRQLADKQEQERRLRAVVADYQAKLDVVPKHESELVELTRDYTTLQTTYQTLLAKRQESEIAANLERRNIGEQFRVLDPARVPERPFSPNRRLIALEGAAAGLALGVLLIALLELTDSTIKREEDIVRLLELPVLAMVPVMATTNRLSRWKWPALVAIIAAAALMSLFVSGAVEAGSVALDEAIKRLGPLQ